jgi:hypothetical protein
MTSRRQRSRGECLFRAFRYFRWTARGTWPKFARGRFRVARGGISGTVTGRHAAPQVAATGHCHGSLPRIVITGCRWDRVNE